MINTYETHIKCFPFWDTNKEKMESLYVGVYAEEGFEPHYDYKYIKSLISRHLYGNSEAEEEIRYIQAGYEEKIEMKTNQSSYKKQLQQLGRIIAIKILKYLFDNKGSI